MSTPAGWYPDPSGVGGLRWWDGAGWTSHTQAAPLQAPVPRYGEYAPAAAAPVDVQTNTVWIWLAIAASIVPFFSIFLMNWDSYIAILGVSSASPSSTSEILRWQWSTLPVAALSWASVAAYIVFCWLDWRELRTRGIAAPFAWAWAFFALASPGAAVYMIGRAVVLRRRTPDASRAPLWVWIIATGVGFVVVIAWAMWLVGEILRTVAANLPV